jgi:hypothetical protein
MQDEISCHNRTGIALRKSEPMSYTKITFSDFCKCGILKRWCDLHKYTHPYKNRKQKAVKK